MRTERISAHTRTHKVIYQVSVQRLNALIMRYTRLSTVTAAHIEKWLISENKGVKPFIKNIGYIPEHTAERREGKR